MRRMRMAVLAAVALVALVAAGVAVADSLNTYTATITSSQSGAGTAAKPVAFGMTEKIGAKPVTTGNPNADPLTDIKVSLPKVKISTAGFPVCSVATITKAGTDAGCPKGALVATGDVTAALWSKTTPTAAGTPCDPVLDQWNAGGGKITNFFKIPAGHECAGLQTGAVAPWVGTVKESGTTAVLDTPLPPPVSTNAGNLGLFSSLEAESIKFGKLTAKVNGKVVPFLASVGCVSGARPYTISLSATDGTTKATTVVTGKTSC